MVVLDRDLLVNLDGGMERARQLHVFDNRNVVCPAISLILKAMLSVPLATQTGAGIPRSYCSATE